MNAHVGKERKEYEEVLGPHGNQTRIEEGEALLDFYLRNRICVANTWFENQEGHKITYRSGKAASDRFYVDQKTGYEEHV